MKSACEFLYPVSYKEVFVFATSSHSMPTAVQVPF